MIWFLEGQSSQRDVIRAAKQVLGDRATVVASHRQARPEITGEADVALQEPTDPDARLDWVRVEALRLGVRVLHVGRAGRRFEQARPSFERAGLTLVTGARSVETFDLLDDKAAFTRRVQAAGLPVVPGIAVDTPAGLRAAIDALAPSGPVCVKPVRGIYGQGFWKLRPDADPFACLANADDRVVSQALFERTYAEARQRQSLLVMPYFVGPECSIDMVCEQGDVIAAVSRQKVGSVQLLERDGEALALATAAVALFGCDGIVNVQTRDDGTGRPHLLEINPRPSGGIGYTLQAGINLPGIFATRRLGLPAPPDRWRGPVTVRPVTVAVPVTF